MAPHLVKRVEGNSEGRGSEYGSEALRSWLKEVESPTFDGCGSLGWISRAEKFFEVQQINPSKFSIYQHGWYCCVLIFFFDKKKIVDLL